MPKLDFRREFPDYFAADAAPHLRRFGAVPYLGVEGQGTPGGPEFQEKVGALFAVAYGAKFAAKAKGHDFTVAALEALWWAPGGKPLGRTPPEKFRWKLLVRVPATLMAADVRAARDAAVKRGNAAAAGVRLERLDEGDCVQVLHVGPYDKERPSLAKLESHAKGLGLRMAGPHHEIYLNDPRRVGPAKAKTILRWPVAAA